MQRVGFEGLAVVFRCNPCKGDRCYAFPEPRCILTISAEQVQKACESILLDVPQIA